MTFAFLFKSARHAFSKRLRQNEIIVFHFRNARFVFSPKRPCSNMKWEALIP